MSTITRLHLRALRQAMKKSAPVTGIRSGAGQSVRKGGENLTVKLYRVKTAPSTTSAPSLKPVGNADDADV